MTKIPFEIVALEVEKLYQKQFNVDQEVEIEQHCEFISSFIESCGYDTDDFIRRLYAPDINEN